MRVNLEYCVVEKRLKILLMRDMNLFFCVKVIDTRWNNIPLERTCRSLKKRNITCFVRINRIPFFNGYTTFFTDLFS